MSMKIKCGCKVNLYLHVKKKRQDGYHELDTLFYPLNTPCDILQISRLKDADVSKISIHCNTEGIDTNDNTLTKAYRLYTEKTGFYPKLFIKLKKSIAHGAGLGGASSNAAALLKYLQKENKTPLPKKKLMKIAKKVGADVPFFLLNKPCRARGIGEILEPVKIKDYIPAPFNKKKVFLILASPFLQVNTKWAFDAFDRIKEKQEKNCSKKKKRKSLTTKHISDKRNRSCFQEDVSKNPEWKNSFESLVFKEYPFLEEIKAQFLKSGAKIALMSGTGSSIFGLFTKQETAKNAYKYLKRSFCTAKTRHSKKQNGKNDTVEKSSDKLIRLYPPVKIT